MSASNQFDGASSTLSIENHDRDAAGYRYVYPVISRRAGGVSIGINLNINNACNWACVYCQVPSLSRGGPPPVDLGRLRQELEQMLFDVLKGDFLTRRVPETMRQLSDVAISGNGEPTSSDQFPEVVSIVGETLRKFDLCGKTPLRLITNGSLMNRKSVQSAVAELGRIGGEVWFKLDRATEQGLRMVNQTEIKIAQIEANLQKAAIAPLWIQACWFAIDGQPPSEFEAQALIDIVARNRQLIKGVHLYGIARPSMQSEAGRLQRLTLDELNRFANRLKEIGVTATVSE